MLNAFKDHLKAFVPLVFIYYIGPSAVLQLENYFFRYYFIILNLVCSFTIVYSDSVTYSATISYIFNLLFLCFSLLFTVNTTTNGHKRHTHL